MSNKVSRDEKVLDLIELTGAITEKTAAVINQQKVKQAAVNQLIPEVVDALLKNERIQPHEKQAALNELKDHERTLAILKETANHRNDKELSKLGSVPNNEKKASTYDSLKDGYTGRRSRPGEAESDKAFKRALGF